MDKNRFKAEFNDVASKYGFSKAFGGWFREYGETLIVLDLQKSNHSNRYYLNIKIFIQGLFGTTNTISKRLIKNDIGNIFTREPIEYQEAFDLGTELSDVNRTLILDRLFRSYIGSLVAGCATTGKILESSRAGIFHLLPAVEEQLTSLQNAI